MSESEKRTIWCGVYFATVYVPIMVVAGFIGNGTYGEDILPPVLMFVAIWFAAKNTANVEGSTGRERRIGGWAAFILTTVVLPVAVFFAVA